MTTKRIRVFGVPVGHMHGELVTDGWMHAARSGSGVASSQVEECREAFSFDLYSCVRPPLSQKGNTKWRASSPSFHD
jgi:hypothetical protein